MVSWAKSRPGAKWRWHIRRPDRATHAWCGVALDLTTEVTTDPNGMQCGHCRWADKEPVA